jgi:parvulin-like peptidyl-prolyl isomerase
LAKLYNQVTAGVSVSDEETKEEYRKANEELSICYVAGLISDFQKDNTASEDELKDYFAKNSLEFKKPLSFNLEYVSADSEDKIRSTYDRLGKKEDFAKVAKELGLEIKETGLFGQTDSIPGLGWLPEISGLIIKLNTGDFLPPMKVDKNYCIFRLKERKEPYIPDFETSKDKVRQVVIKNKARQTAQGKMQACLKYLKDIYRQAPNKEIDFEKIGKELGLKSASTGAFKYGSYIEGLGASDDFWEAARALKEKEFSDLIATPLGFYIIKTKSRTPLDEGKFAQDKPAFAQRLLELKKQESFAKFLTELKKKTQLY